jgi:membrane protease YdiL (CAAX protease family)
MNTLSRLVRRHPLPTFFALSYALSWALWIPLTILRDRVPGPYVFVALLIGSNVPSAVAILLTVAGRRPHSTRELLDRLLIWRIGVQWYLLLLAPTALVVGAITWAAMERGGSRAVLAVPLVSAVVTVAFMIFPGSALGEEIGWRGFALPHLQSARTALTASLVLGALHALWHLPLWLRGLPDHSPALYPAFAIQVIAMAVIYTWMYNGTGGSLLLVVLFHAATNAPLTLVLLPLGIDAYTVPFWLMSGLTVIAAIVVVTVFGPSQLSRRQPRQQTRLSETPADGPVAQARITHYVDSGA